MSLDAARPFEGRPDFIPPQPIRQLLEPVVLLGSAGSAVQAAGRRSQLLRSDALRREAGERSGEK
jgi:hypothetical protein